MATRIRAWFVPIACSLVAGAFGLGVGVGSQRARIEGLVGLYGAREGAWKRLALDAAGAADVRAAREEADGRDRRHADALKVYAESVAARWIRPVGAERLWMRGEYRIHPRPDGWIVEGIAIDSYSAAHFWSLEVVPGDRSVQGAGGEFRATSMVWDLGLWESGDGEHWVGPRPLNYPGGSPFRRLEFRD